MNSKPRLKYIPILKLWRCASLLSVAFGHTPEQAYMYWEKLNRIPSRIVA